MPSACPRMPNEPRSVSKVIGGWAREESRRKPPRARLAARPNQLSKGEMGMATAAELQVRERIFIGGEWVEPEGADALEVINSTTEEVMGTVPGCTAVSADRAVEAAREAFESWSRTSREERAGHLAAIAAGLGERAEEIAATISQELGMPLTLSRMIQA